VSAGFADRDLEGICEQIVELSQQMLEHGARGDWRGLGELDARRLELARRISTQAIPPAGSSDCIERCLKLDAEILALCEAAHQRVAGQLRSITQGQRIQATYTQGG